MNEVKTSVESFIESMIAKYKLSADSFNNWKIKVFEKVTNKIRMLKSIGKTKKSKQILKDTNVLEYLTELHNNYVIVPIDKMPTILLSFVNGFM